MRRTAGFPLPSEARIVPAGRRVRTYRLHRPGGRPPVAPAPLVVVLHGGFGSGAQAERAYGWDALADRHGFQVAYPDGVGRSWNAGWCCGPARDQGVDDAGFIEALLDQVASEGGVDDRRIYAAGMSNGAMLAYRLACDLPGRLAAIGPVAGTMAGECPRPAPVSILHIHGLEDRNVPFAGGPGSTGSTGSRGGRRVGSQPRPSVPSVIDYWRRGAGCGAPVVAEAGPIRTETATAPSGVEVCLIALAGVGHVWPGSHPPPPQVSAMLGLDPPSDVLDATGLLWGFFAAHPRPG